RFHAGPGFSRGADVSRLKDRRTMGSPTAIARLAPSPTAGRGAMAGGYSYGSPLLFHTTAFPSPHAPVSSGAPATCRRTPPAAFRLAEQTLFRTELPSGMRRRSPV